MATRCMPIKKKDNTTRPVGVGDVLRRTILKSIDEFHKKVSLFQTVTDSLEMVYEMDAKLLFTH